jgi:hypothetical protein
MTVRIAAMPLGRTATSSARILRELGSAEVMAGVRLAGVGSAKWAGSSHEDSWSTGVLRFSAATSRFAGRRWVVMASPEHAMIDLNVRRSDRRAPGTSDQRVRLRRVAFAVGASAAMVLTIAALVPRSLLANDDIALTEFLRKDVFTPWISPILARALGFAYGAAPEVPWYGLYLYALILATGAVLIHTCIELVDRRPGFGRLATWIGASLVGASHAILVVGITWTTVSISAIGTAVAAFVAHAQTCEAAGRPASRLRTLTYGLLLVAGLALRADAAGASAVALLPMLGWAGLRFVWNRRLPRLGALIALLAPSALVLAMQDRIPPARSGAMTDYAEFNSERGRLSDRSAYTGLDERAPELLARAGWTVDEYRDFMTWLLIDENDYSPEKIKRLVDTGGMPESFTWAYAKRELGTVYDQSAPSIVLAVTMLIVGVALASLGTIARWRGLTFGLGYAVLLLGVPLWMSAFYRFPQRVSLSFYTVAALGVFVYLARQVADRPAGLGLRPSRDRRVTVALVVIAVFAFSWARYLIAWLDQSPWAYRDEVQALEDRVAARKAFVFVHIQTGLVDLDPLRALPRGYEGLQGGWATFSAPWYDSIARLGVHRGSEVLGAMVDNPDAYLLAAWDGRDALEEWIRRKVGNPDVRLAFVDAAVLPWNLRPTLYRVVTHPMQRGDHEWRARQRDEWQMNNTFPGPPGVTGLTFRSMSLAAPYESHLAPLRHPTAATVEPIDGGLRCMVAGNTGDGCTVTSADGNHAGVHIPVNGLRAARFEVTLIDTENIESLDAYAQTRTSGSIRWRWELSPEAQEFGFAGTFTLVPGYSARRLQLAVDTARPRDIQGLDILISVKPGSHAGFELRHIEVAEP